MALDSIHEVDITYWLDGSAEVATDRKVVEHCRLIMDMDMDMDMDLDVDVTYPIILGHDDRVMDGMPRVARALLEGRAEIDAVRFPAPLEPYYRDCLPRELPYW